MDTKAQYCKYSLWLLNLYTKVVFEFYEDYTKPFFKETEPASLY